MTPFSAWFSQLSQRDRVCIQGAQRNLTFSLSGSLSGPGWCGAKSEYCQSAHQHDGNHSKYSQWLHEVAHVYNWCNSRDIIVQVCCLFPVGHDKWRKSFCLLCCAMYKDITDSLTLWLWCGPCCWRPWLDILWESAKQSVVTEQSSAPGSWQTSDSLAQSSLSCFLPSLHVIRVCGAPLISTLFFKGTRIKWVCPLGLLYSHWSQSGLRKLMSCQQWWTLPTRCLDVWKKCRFF